VGSLSRPGVVLTPVRSGEGCTSREVTDNAHRLGPPGVGGQGLAWAYGGGNSLTPQGSVRNKYCIRALPMWPRSEASRE
jgi:hypothetical protein